MSGVRPFARSAIRPLRGVVMERRWALLLLDQDLAQVLQGHRLSGTVLEPTSRWLYWADPFPIGARENCWVLAEEFDRWAGLGTIVALRIEDGHVASQQTVLASSHHLSFPQAHRFNGEWIATVESCDPRATIYRFRRPGDPWVPTEWRLPDALIDPALSRAHNGSWRLTGTRRTGPGDIVDEWASPGPGPTGWELVRTVPAGSCARGAGRLDYGRGLRAAQDGGTNYGAAVSITGWPGADEVLRIEAGAVATPGVGSWTGAHTCTWTEDGATVLLDLWRRRVQPLSGLHRWREFRLDPCRKKRS